MLLTACEKPEPEIINKPYPVPAHVPERLRTCPEIPKSYNYVSEDSEGEALQSEVADYITVLHRVARTCKTNLDAVDDILDDHEDTVRNRSTE